MLNDVGFQGHSQNGLVSKALIKLERLVASVICKRIQSVLSLGCAVKVLCDGMVSAAISHMQDLPEKHDN